MNGARVLPARVRSTPRFFLEAVRFVRYSLGNRSGSCGPAAVGSPGHRTGGGLSLILDLAAHQRLRSQPPTPGPATGKSGHEAIARSSVLLSHLPIPDLSDKRKLARSEAIHRGDEGSGLTFFRHPSKPLARRNCRGGTCVR